ncbi:MAG: OmpA family protein [Cyanobacteria bacterium P01_A01_bin.114]
MTDESQFQPISPPGASASPQPVPPPLTQTGGRSMGCLTGIFRLLLLGVGLPVAWLAGVGVAQFFPGGARPVPLQEITLRKTNRVFKTVRHLPKHWQQSPTQETRIEPVPIPTTPIEPLTPPPVLNSLEKQIAAEELTALQQELETLKRRLSDLETTLGRSQSTASFESRLQALEADLSENQPSENQPSENRPPSGTPSDTSSPQTAPADSQLSDPLFQVSALKITLPSDALFIPGEARLLETAPTILDRILADLRPYKNATILVGAHTDDRSENEVSRDLSLQQANTLQAYLSGKFSSAAADSSSQFRWVTIGYGLSQPVTENQTPEDRQRNRRIEISVDTRR